MPSAPLSLSLCTSPRQLLRLLSTSIKTVYPTQLRSQARLAARLWLLSLPLQRPLLAPPSYRPHPRSCLLRLHQHQMFHFPRLRQLRRVSRLRPSLPLWRPPRQSQRLWNRLLWRQPPRSQSLLSEPFLPLHSSRPVLLPLHRLHQLPRSPSQNNPLVLQQFPPRRQLSRYLRPQLTLQLPHLQRHQHPQSQSYQSRRSTMVAFLSASRTTLSPALKTTLAARLTKRLLVNLPK
jgi:hypothetical protein